MTKEGVFGTGVYIANITIHLHQLSIISLKFHLGLSGLKFPLVTQHYSLSSAWMLQFKFWHARREESVHAYSPVIQTSSTALVIN